VAARSNRCLALIKSQKYAMAESDANVILAQDGDNIKARLRRGWARFELKRYQDAVVDLRRCLELEVGEGGGKGGSM
jgi:tetratricopeptide (TPR) repeat protein